MTKAMPMRSVSRTPVSVQSVVASEMQMATRTWDKKAKGYEFRNLIRSHMKDQDVSSYWIANKVSETNKDLVTPDAVYRYLRGETDATGAVIAAILKTLKVKLPSKP